MGTNYYITVDEKLCPTCGVGESTELHIGKQSAGWRFMLHPEPLYWRDTYELFQFLLEYQHDGDYHLHNDNGVDCDEVGLIERILSRREAKCSEHRDGYDNVCDHSVGDFS